MGPDFPAGVATVLTACTLASLLFPINKVLSAPKAKTVAPAMVYTY